MYVYRLPLLHCVLLCVRTEDIGYKNLSLKFRSPSYVFNVKVDSLRCK